MGFGVNRANRLGDSGGIRALKIHGFGLAIRADS